MSIYTDEELNRTVSIEDISQMENEKLALLLMCGALKFRYRGNLINQIGLADFADDIEFAERYLACMQAEVEASQRVLDDAAISNNQTVNQFLFRQGSDPQTTLEFFTERLRFAHIDLKRAQGFLAECRA